MSNFSFLERYGSELSRRGADAELYLYDRPKTCAIELRAILEDIAGQVAKEKGLDGRRDKSKTWMKATFDENLLAIKQAHIAPSAVIDDFYYVKEKGNARIHT